MVNRDLVRAIVVSAGLVLAAALFAKAMLYIHHQGAIRIPTW